MIPEWMMGFGLLNITLALLIDGTYQLKALFSFQGETKIDLFIVLIELFTFLLISLDYFAQVAIAKIEED